MSENNIITPDQLKQEKQVPIVLSRARAQELAIITRQLRALHAKTIAEPSDEDQKVALTQALATGLMTHCDELIGCWFAVKDEYEPLTVGIAAIFRRSNSINGALAQQANARRAASAAAEGEATK